MKTCKNCIDNDDGLCDRKRKPIPVQKYTDQTQ